MAYAYIYSAYRHESQGYLQFFNMLGQGRLGRLGLFVPVPRRIYSRFDRI